MGQASPNLLLLDQIAKSITAAMVQNPSIPGVNDNNRVITQQAVKQEVIKEVAPVVAHLTNNEPWYQSRVTWGAIVTGIASVGAGLGFALSPEDVDVIIGLAATTGSLVGAGITLYGRWVARKPLGA